MQYFTFDLGDLWTDFKALVNFKYQCWVDSSEAPPSIRHYDMAFISLKDNENKTIGCFVPELYELAKANGMRAQQEKALWEQQHPRARIQTKKKQPFYAELYNKNGKLKTPFELAVLPVPYSDHDKKSARSIQKKMEDEYNFLIENGKALPPIVFKFQIESDYLKNIDLINLRASAPRSIKLNLINPSNQTKAIERWAHYFAQTLAPILTLIAVLTFAHSLPILASIAAVIVAKWCSKDFETFDLVESLLREVKSNFAKEYRLGEKISLKKTIKTLGLLSALGYCAVVAFMGELNSIIDSPFISIFPVGQYPIAIIASTITALGVFIGGSIALRFFWGLGCWDKQIDFSKERAPQLISPKERLEKKLAHLQQTFQKELTPILSVENYNKVNQQANKQITQLRDLVQTNLPVEMVSEGEGRYRLRSAFQRCVG